MNASLELPILYADAKIVVVDKPSGLLSVPGRGPENQDCVVTRIQAMFPECRKYPSVHRLDMDTSGLLVLALTARANSDLFEQFRQRQVSKRYFALLDGVLDDDCGVIDLPIRLDIFDRPRQIYDPVHGKASVTDWRRLGEVRGRTLVEFTPHTGRTHQLRVHSSHSFGLGRPIVGDRLYGTGTGPGQLRLHACHLRFAHPKTGETMEFNTRPSAAWGDDVLALCPPCDGAVAGRIVR
ncbi:tRNA pseudouridine32 synthase/23S rRNA pseudouridine746 synthase [Desulfobaculum xiamenense]|uniref:tRNA pseudouridine32 synthase/23S rRNA pseudouridine746 synthase n=1 Tax=Desulfobaculum xiamenense TaxID=995050 RepID=A0A846QP83_9BACT|nr:RluA family pseudouridine synthase [Desulfobaculum xiamenense]NJB68292.1 tRNA pseudouridine32 synthase/23S rRNA pseudouridine746 synthase [Desulfobaculum xiamenense]